MLRSADGYQKCSQLSPIAKRRQIAPAFPNRVACLRRNLAWVMFLGIFSVSSALTMDAQTPAPQTLPYVHTIVAGSGVAYTPAAQTGSTTAPRRV